MTNQETTAILTKLFDAFPSLAAWYAKHADTVRSVWLGTLSTVEAGDAESVVARLVGGHIEMPPNYEYDRIAIMIRRECARLADRRAEMVTNEQRRRERERFRYCEDARQANSEMERFMPAMRQLMAMGELKRDGKLSAEENNRRCEIVKTWYEDGGDVPEFM